MKSSVFHSRAKIKTNGQKRHSHDQHSNPFCPAALTDVTLLETWNDLWTRQNQGKVLFSCFCFHTKGWKPAVLDRDIERQFQTHGNKSSKLGWALANQPRQTPAYYSEPSFNDFSTLSGSSLVWEASPRKADRGKIKKMGSTIHNNLGAHLPLLFLNTPNHCPPPKPISPEPPPLYGDVSLALQRQRKGIPGLGWGLALFLPHFTPWLSWDLMFLLGELHTVTLTAQHSNL